MEHHTLDIMKVVFVLIGGISLINVIFTLMRIQLKREGKIKDE